MNEHICDPHDFEFFAYSGAVMKQDILSTGYPTLLQLKDCKVASNMQQQQIKIKWHIEYRKFCSLPLIVIENCPVCGKPGRLVSQKPPRKMVGRRYLIKHDRRSNRGCSISWFHPAWEEINRIYEMVRCSGEEK